MMALLCGGCRKEHGTTAVEVKTPLWEHASATDSVDAIARDYVLVALALGERDPDSIDFALVPPAMTETAHRIYPSYGETAQEAESLQSRLGALELPSAPEAEDRVRAQFLAFQLRAIVARIGMLQGHNPGFDEEAQLLFNTARLPDTKAEAAHRKATRTEIVQLLPGPRIAGKTDAERYGLYDRRFLVPGDKLQAVMTAALATCRERTLKYLTMPHDESVELAFVHNKPWSAFSRYQGHAHSLIQINLDLPVTVDDALELACHEGYPGHHVFNTLRDEALLERKHWPEMQVQLTFTPQSYVSEAAAAYAPRMAFSEAERAKIERDILFPLAGFSATDADRYVKISSLIRELASSEPAIAREYLDGHLEFVRAEQQLDAEALMDHPEAQLLYLNEFRSYMLAYTDGPRRIAAALPADGTAEARWKAYEQIMLHLQSTLPDPASR